MTRALKVLEVLRYIRAYPNRLQPPDLARLCDMSERNVYRCLADLERGRVLVRHSSTGYQVADEDPVGDIDIELARVERKLLLAGMARYNDPETQRIGTILVENLDERYPGIKTRLFPRIRLLQGGEELKRQGEVVIGHGSVCRNLDPMSMYDGIGRNLLPLIFSYLIHPDPARNWELDLAEDMKSSEDGRVWVFRLRRNVTFHDGKSLTAKDVQYSYEKQLDRERTEEYSMLVEDFAAKGEHTFTLKLKRPVRSDLYYVNLPIFSVDSTRVGSGPFKLDGNERDKITMIANAKYFRQGRPGIQRLVFRSFDSRRVAREALIRGEVDILIDMSPTPLVTESGPYRIYPIVDGSYYCLFLNVQSPIFRDPNLRYAIDHGIEKRSLVSVQLHGYGSICKSALGRNILSLDEQIEPREYSLAKATNLLRGRRPTIVMALPHIAEGVEAIAVAIKAQLSKLGIDVQSNYVAQVQAGNYDMALMRLCPGSSTHGLAKFWTTNARHNYSHYSNTVVDELFQVAGGSRNIKLQEDAYRQIHTILHKDCPAILLVNVHELILSRFALDSAALDSTFSFLLHLVDSYIEH